MKEEQAKYVYKKIESGGIINADTLHQEIEQERQLSRIDDTSGETNTYKELIVNNKEKIEPLLTQWNSGLSLIMHSTISDMTDIQRTIIVEALVW